jgi:hypothetical protein
MNPLLLEHVVQITSYTLNDREQSNDFGIHVHTVKGGSGLEIVSIVSTLSSTSKSIRMFNHNTSIFFRNFDFQKTLKILSALRNFGKKSTSHSVYTFYTFLQFVEMDYSQKKT